MRLSVIALLSASVLIVAGAASWAQEEYYVELGNETSEENAIAEWKALVKKHKDTLGKLKFIPKTVLKQGNNVVTRIQAGPIESKAKAIKLCAQLFKLDTPCFVMEGFESLPPLRRASAPVEGALPWLDEKPQPDSAPLPKPVTLSAEEERKNFMPWRPVEPMVIAPQTQAIAMEDATGSGSVKVDEAIRVPLTREEEEKPLLQPLIKPQSAAVAPPSPEPVQTLVSANAGPGWLDVESFSSEASAMALWKSAHEAVPEKAAGLRVRVIKPLKKSERAALKLNIGPFASEYDAMSFCSQGILPKNTKLHCVFERSAPVAKSTLMATRYEHTDRYAARRHATQPRRSLQGNSTMLSASSQVYWVQVASAPSQIDALAAWDRLRSENTDLLQNMRSSVSTSASGNSAYVVRVGPFTSHDKALELFNALKERGISGRIYSNM